MPTTTDATPHSPSHTPPRDDAADFLAMSREGEAADAQRAAAAASRAAMLAALDARVPRQYAGATLDSFTLRHVTTGTADYARLSAKKDKALGYAWGWPKRVGPTFPHIVAFCGAPGTGKTLMAWALARTIVREYGARVDVASFPDVMRELRGAWRRERGESTEAAILERHRRPDLLVLDEVSRHAFYGEVTQHLYDLVAPREAELRPTILVSNEEPDAFMALVGGAIASRINGSGGVWDFGRLDYRAWRAAGEPLGGARAPAPELR